MTVQSTPHSLWLEFRAEIQEIHRVARSHPVNLLNLSKETGAFSLERQIY
jgi:hypothetical protein